MKIVVTGASGQLGQELVRQFGDQAEGLTSRECDLRNPSLVAGTLFAMRPDVIINSAAYTAVDRAEADAAACEQVNASAVQVMADVADELGCTLVQISTDYVFGGTTDAHPHTENDPIHPEGVYARSKANGEVFATEAEKHLVIRSCGLYRRPLGPPTRGANFVETMLSLAEEMDHLKIVNDQWCTPTYVPELAAAIKHLVTEEVIGCYHVTNRGVTNWFDFAQHLFDLAGCEIELEPISTAEYNAPAPRPSFSALDTSKYHDQGGPRMSTWQSALESYVEERRSILDQRAFEATT